VLLVAAAALPFLEKEWDVVGHQGFLALLAVGFVGV
jgi:hypothetical protein